MIAFSGGIKKNSGGRVVNNPDRVANHFVNLPCEMLLRSSGSATISQDSPSEMLLRNNGSAIISQGKLLSFVLLWVTGYRFQVAGF